uniref:Glycosyltransferase family 92 protein n=1 Tax=Strongyloides venezuelensis TaxID=75913 RepID=A0A0K0F413_STRVS
MIKILFASLFLYQILIVNASNCQLKNTRYITNNTANFDSLHIYSFHVVPENYYASRYATVKGFMVAYCENKYTKNPKKEYLIADIDGKKFNGIVKIMEYSFCVLKHINCRLEIFYVNFNIPRNFLVNRENITIIDNGSKKKRVFKLSSEAANSEVYDGITICTPTLYWYNNWIQMFTFLEYWRKQSNVHIVIHYRGMSSNVFKLINYYKDLGLVTLVPTPALPKQKGKNIETFIFGFGGKVYLNSCMYSKNTKYVLAMDSDEYIQFFKNKTQNVYDFVEKEIKLRPYLESVNFRNVRASYTHRNITETFRFAQQYYYYKDTINKEGKSVVRTSKVDMISYHKPVGISRKQQYRINNKVALVLHARPNYVTINVKGKRKIPKALLFNENERLVIVKHYKEIKEKVLNGTLQFNYDVKLANSLKITDRYKPKKYICYFDYNESKKYVSKLDNWIYGEEQCNMERIFVPF